jgi:hypothetical protein
MRTTRWPAVVVASLIFASAWMSPSGNAVGAGTNTADDVVCPATHCVGAADLGFGNLDNAAEDASFERSPSAGTQGWPYRAGTPAWVVVTDSANCLHGNRCAKRTGNGTQTGAELGNASLVEAKPGDTFYLEGWLKGDSGTTGSGGVQLSFLDKAGALITTVQTALPATTTYGNRSVSATAPASTVAVKAAFSVIGHSAGNWWADAMYFRHQITGNTIAPNTIGLGNLQTSVDRRYFLTTGFGLTRTDSPTGPSHFSVNTVTVQQRVSGTCPAGQTIRAVAQNGTVACDVSGTAYYAYRDADHGICDSGCTEATLSVPTGTYAIFSKEHFSGGDFNYAVAAGCVLSAGADSDGSLSQPVYGTDAGSIQVNLEVVHTFTATGNITLACADNGAVTSGNAIKIIAIRLGAQTRSALP